MSEESLALKQALNPSIKESIESQSKHTQKLKPERASVNEVLTESLVTNEDPDLTKKRKKYKIFVGTGCCCLVFGLFLALFGHTILLHLAINGAIDQAILTPDNEDLWAHFPGQSETIITRNYSFFNLTNEYEMLLYGEQPKFREIEGYKIQQFQDFLNITYNEDQSKVKMRDWLYFHYYNESRDLSQKVKVLNLGGLGYWNQLKASRETVILLQGLSLLFSNMEASLVNTVLGQGVSTQYLPDWDSANNALYSPAGISQENSHFLWEDTAYGMSNKNNLRYWVQASMQSFSGDEPGYSSLALDLKDYFTLSDSEMVALLSTFSTFADSVYGLIIQNHYCDGIQNCNDRELAIRQMAVSYVTYNTPPVSSIVPTDTICTDNVTCTGFYPQISAYFNNVYVKKHPEVDPYLTFDIESVRRLMDYNPENIPNQYNKAEYALLHIGNLDALWQNGTAYDAETQQEKKNEYLNNIQNRFQLESPAHAKVIWEWAKYLTNQFIRGNSTTNERVGISSTFAQGFYDSFTFLQQNLQFFMLKEMIKVSLSGRECVDFVKTSFQIADPQKVTKICNNYNHQITSDVFIGDMVGACRNKFQTSWQKLINMTITYIQAQSLCDSSIQGGFGALYSQSRKKLNSFYNCDQTPTQYCSDFQLALKQWSNSSVTGSVPQQISYLKSTTTFADWLSEALPFQYGHYRSKFPQKQFPVLTIEYCYDNMNFQHWLSANVITKVFGDDDTPLTIKNYIRYVVIFMGLKFTQERTAEELIFGYEDQFLQAKRTAYPPFGGDPSIASVIRFNDQNISEQEAITWIQWYTGKDDYTKTAQYSLINDMDYIAVNYTKFNGNQTYWQFDSPWIGHDHFYGTNGKRFNPNLVQDSGNVSIYVPNIQRYGGGSSSDAWDYERFGYNLRVSFLGKQIFQSTSQSDINAKYYQSYYGVFNETSVLGFPFFVTKHHFMNCTSNWTDIIKVYNEDESILYKETSHWDDSFIIVQPFSGAAFQSILYLQSNYYYQPDQLFVYNQTSMLPVFSVARAGNITQDKANELFSSLKTVYSLDTASLYVGIILGVLGALGAGFGIKKLSETKSDKEIKIEQMEAEKKKTKMKISLQKVDANQKHQQVFNQRPMIKEKSSQVSEEYKVDEEMHLKEEIEENKEEMKREEEVKNQEKQEEPKEEGDKNKEQEDEQLENLEKPVEKVPQSQFQELQQEKKQE